MVSSHDCFIRIPPRIKSVLFLSLACSPILLSFANLNYHLFCAILRCNPTRPQPGFAVCDAWSLLSHSQKSNSKWLHWVLNLEHLMTLSPYFILFPFISVIYLTSCYGICSLGADTFHLCIPVKTQIRKHAQWNPFLVHFCECTA